MDAQQKLIADHFTELGGRVQFQSFDAVHPISGVPVRMSNIIVSWHPEARERVLVACHYDTRPFPDRDPSNPQGRFVGANDGASGVALLMELGHHLPQIQPTYGVDFVFFDGEELVFGDGLGRKGEYFLGSKHFSTAYRDRPPAHSYVWGVLVDMIGDRNLNLYMEKKSYKYARQVTESLWETAAQLNVAEFIPRVKHDVEDDHVPLNQIARIPTCDIIDFDYPYWHTTRDVPSQCSGASLEKVGRVVLQWLQVVPAPEG
jgi:Zn-dependent M28 family amino/carboxypeptidase